MSHYTQTTAEIAMMFQLKGGLYPLTALQLLGTDLLTFEAQLTAKIAQAPKFFHHAPVVIDLQKLKPDAKIDYQQLVGILQSRHLIPVGVRGGSSEQQTAATRVGLPILQDPPKEISKTTPPPAHVQETLAKEPEMRSTQTMLITEPVRSGQQIYARGGDLVVLAPVSHGAELLADGNIHIYGPLRGRALAGVTGDETAHIFCQHLEAELVSIAGQYQISEDIEPALWQKAADIALQQGRLHIRLL